MTVVRNLIIRGGADFSSLRNEMRRAQKNVADFKSAVSGSIGKIGMALGAVGLGSLAADASRTAMDVESAMQQIARLMGDNATSFFKWSEDTAVAFNMSKANAIKYGAIFGNLTSTFSEGMADTKTKTIDLLKASAVVASGTGRTMDDVMWRIRSGLLGNTEAIEDLGINVYVNMLKSTNAFRQFAGDKSWDQLDFKTQQLIRYYGILEQANKKFGVSVNENTNSTLQQFQAALGNVKLALGQAFLPILGWVLPILTKMANALARVMNVVAQFMQALFGYKVPAIKTAAVSDDAAVAVDGMGDSMDKAAKKTKKAAKAVKELDKNKRGLAGFDELNLLPDPTKKDKSNKDSGGAGAGGAGGAGGGPSLPVPDQKPFDGAFTKISDKIKRMAEKFKAFFAPVVAVFKKAWEFIWSYLQIKFASIKKIWKDNGAQFLQAMKNIWNFLKPIVNWLIGFLWDSIKGAIDGIIQVFKGIIEFIAGVFTGDWGKAWEGIKDIFFGLIKAIWNIMNLMLFKGLIMGLGKLILGLGKGFFKLVGKIKIPFNKLGGWFKNLGKKIWEGMLAPFKAGGGWFKENVVDKITAAFGENVDIFKQRAGAIWEAIKGAFTGVLEWFKVNLVDPIAQALKDGITTTVQRAKDIWNAITGAFSAASTWFKTNVVDKIASSFSGAKQAIQTKAGEAWGWISGKFSAVYAWFRDNVAGKLAAGFAGVKNKIQVAASGAWGWIKGKFTGIYDWFKTNVADKIASSINAVKDTVSRAAGNVWSKVKGGFSGVYNWFKTNVADKISSAISNISAKFKDKISGGIKTVLNKFITFFNSAIGMFNKFKNKLPFGWGSKIPNIPSIPKLAQGGYVGANKPLLAMIGDNRNEGEIVAPESKIYEQVMKALASSGGGGRQELVVNIGGTTVFRKLIDGINQAQRQAGRTLINI